MSFLLDTHAFIWSILDLKKLSSKAIEAIEDPDTEIYVSAISLWEISIKTRLGKMRLLDISTDDLIPSAERMGFDLIPLNPSEAVSQGALIENTHFDPFDRMLVWQAISRGMILISKDKSLKKFESDGLRLLWK
jgi:PIN domain nuclease of toxin-antitoxin system